MRLRRRSAESSFYGLFAESAARLVTGAGLVAQMLDAGADRPTIAKQMREVEQDADETTHRIARLANLTFVTPFDREDIQALAEALDDVIDYMDETVDKVVLYELEDLPPEFSQQVEVLQQGCRVTAEAMPGLRSMKGLEEFWIEINQLENEGDRNHRRAMARLLGGDYKALQALKLKDVAESLEAGIDALETVANIVERIVTKES
jgi:uncharacterized protein Yka (UPF0111/DUF47 family)